MHYAVANILRLEAEQGFWRIEEAPWLIRDDWHEIVLTKDGKRVRLVLLEARNPGNGAFTRLIAGITTAELCPVICEPNDFLIEWCKRHDYRPRTVGTGHGRVNIWYPRNRH
jgi:hypothetical protein